MSINYLLKKYRNMKLTYIKDFNKGMTINGFFICKKIECKLTRLGDEYLDLILQDKTGVIRGKVWSGFRGPLLR